VKKRVAWAILATGVLAVVLAGAGGAVGSLRPASTRAQISTYGGSCNRPRSDTALKLCVAADLKHDDRVMAEAVEQAKKRFRGALVVEAQADFESYADAECRVAASLNVGGSDYPLEVNRCEIQLVLERVAQLETDTGYAKQLESG
jgi:uncharacterized protein YecT (DUF1311 family)